MSRMGTTPTIAFLVLAVASLVAMPHASAAVTVRDLGTLPGYTWSEALGINAAGQIVGTSGDMESQSRPFLWDDGVMTNLGRSAVPAAPHMISAIRVSSSARARMPPTRCTRSCGRAER